MIFVTVGTTYFDSLVCEVDRLVERGVLREHVLMQIGQGHYVPQHAPWIRYVDNIRELEEAADLVICHAGVGSIFELLALRKPFLAVPNRDVKDDHQADLLRALEAEGACTCCWNLSDLATLVLNPRAPTQQQRPIDLPATIWRNCLDMDTHNSATAPRASMSEHQLGDLTFTVARPTFVFAACSSAHRLTSIQSDREFTKPLR